VILSGTALTSSLLFFAVAGITPLQAGCSYLQALAYSNCTSTTGSTNINITRNTTSGLTSAIYGANNGTGNVSITVTGATSGTLGDGIDAVSVNGNISVVANGAVSGGINGISSSANGSGSIVIGGMSNVSGFVGAGISARANGGNVTVANPTLSVTPVINITAGVLAVANDGAMGNAANQIWLNANAATGVGLRATGTFGTSRNIVLQQSQNAIEVSNGNTLTLNSAFTWGNAANSLYKNDMGSYFAKRNKD